MNVFVDIFSADFFHAAAAVRTAIPAAGRQTGSRITGRSRYPAMERILYVLANFHRAEIEAKRITVRRPILDLNKQNGQLVVWPTDSNKVKYGKYFLMYW